jgi:hypothetical protein
MQYQGALKLTMSMVLNASLKLLCISLQYQEAHMMLQQHRIHINNLHLFKKKKGQLIHS